MKKKVMPVSQVETPVTAPVETKPVAVKSTPFSKFGGLKKKILLKKNKPTEPVSTLDNPEVDILGRPLKPMMINKDLNSLPAETTVVKKTRKPSMMSKAKMFWASHKPMKSNTIVQN